MMPPARRTRAMGFSPGGAQALDINAPTRKRKKNLQQDEASESAADHPSKRTRSESTEDNDENAPSQSTSRSIATKPRRTVRKASEPLNTTDSHDLPSTLMNSPQKTRPTRRTRAAANIVDAELSVNTLQAGGATSSTPAEKSSKKRGGYQINYDSPSGDEEADAKPRPGFWNRAVSRRAERRAQEENLSRFEDANIDSQNSSTLVANPKEESGLSMERRLNATSQSQQVQQSSLTQAPGSPDATSTVVISSQVETDSNPTPRPEGRLKTHEEAVFTSDSASNTSENLLDVDQDSVEYADDLSGDDAQTTSEEVETTLQVALRRQPQPEFIPRKLRHQDSPDNLRTVSTPSIDMNRQPQFVSTQALNLPPSSSPSRASNHPPATKSSSGEVVLLQLTDSDIVAADLDKSSVWRFVQRSNQRKMEANLPQFEDDDIEELLEKGSPPKYYSRKDIDSARRASRLDHMDSIRTQRLTPLESARYFEWKEDVDAMFVVKSKKPQMADAERVGSNRENHFNQLIPSELLTPPLKVHSLTDQRIIEAVSNTLQLCEENPESIPTKAELSSLFKDTVTSRRDKSSSIFWSPFSLLQNSTSNASLATRSPAPQTPNPQTPRPQTPRRQTQQPQTPTTLLLQEPSGSLVASSSANNIQQEMTPISGAAHEPHEQPEIGRNTWASALSASRIGSLLQTPLRYFSRASQNVPATDVRPSGTQVHQTNLTRSDRSNRTVRPNRGRNSTRLRAPQTPTPAHQIITPARQKPTPSRGPMPGRRPDAHLPVHLKGCRYEDLPPEYQAVSQHMKPKKGGDKRTPKRPQPMFDVNKNPLTVEEQKFLDDNRDAVLRRREQHLLRLRAGRTEPDGSPIKDSVTQVVQDLSRDEPGSKRKRVTFALDGDTLDLKTPGTGRFAVPDDDTDEEATPIVLSHKRSPRLSVPGAFSPAEDRENLPAKKQKYGPTGNLLTGNTFLDATVKEVFPYVFAQPTFPKTVLNNPGREMFDGGWSRENPPPPDPIYKTPTETKELNKNVFGSEPLVEISANKANQANKTTEQPSTTKSILKAKIFQTSEDTKKDESQLSKVHIQQPKTPSNLSQADFASPIAGAAIESASVPKLAPNADYGRFITDPEVIAALNDCQTPNNTERVESQLSKFQAHQPKTPSKLRQVDIASPIASPIPWVTGSSGVVSLPNKIDYGPHVTDSEVLAVLNTIPDEHFDRYRLPASVYKEMGMPPPLHGNPESVMIN